MSLAAVLAIDVQPAILPNPVIVSLDVSASAALAGIKLDGSMRQSPLETASGNCVLVVEKSQLRGIVTSGDRLRWQAEGRSLAGVTIADIMTTPVIHIPQRNLTDLTVALHLLQQHCIHHLPVVNDDGYPVGVITSDSLQQCLWAVLQPQVEKQKQSSIAGFPAVQSLQFSLQESALELLCGLTQEISAAADFKAALDVTLRQICNVADWCAGEVWLPTIDRTGLQLGSTYCQPQAPTVEDFQAFSRTLTFVPNQGLPGRVWQSQQSEWIVELAALDQDQFLRAEVAQTLGFQSACGVPILTAEGVVAVLVFFSVQVRQPDRAFLQLMQSIASQLGQVLCRKQAEAALRQSEAINRAIITAIPDLLIQVDRQGRYLQRLSGGELHQVLLPPADAAQATAHNVLPQPLADQLTQAIEQALTTGTLQTYEHQIELQGKRCWEEVRVIPLNSNEALVMVRDMTTRKQTEQTLHQLNQELETRIEQRTAALRESEERWQLALQGSKASIWDWNLRTNEVFRSCRWQELRGLAADAVDPQSWMARIHPEDRDRVLTTLTDHLARKIPFYQEEYRIQRPDGTYLWILDRGQALWDEAGNPVRMIGSEMDITRRKQAELEAQLLRERLQFVLSSSPAVIFTCQPFGSYAATFVSDNIVTLTGYTAAEVVADPHFWVNHLHPEDEAQVFSGMPMLLERGQHIQEYRFRHKAGHYLWGRNELRLIRNEQGEPIEVVGYFADVSDRKHAEALLRKSEAHLAAAQRIARLGSWEFNLQTYEICWSDETYQIFDRPLADGPPTLDEFLQYLHPEDRARVEQAVLGVLENGQPFESEYRLSCSKGGLRYILSRGELVLNETGQPNSLVGTVLDISDRKQAEAQLQNLSDRFTLAIRSGSIGIWEWDVVQNVLIWDDRMYELYGLRAENFEGAYQAWAKGVYPDDRAAAEAAIQQALSGEKEFDIEFRVRHPSGAIRFIKAYGLVQRDSQGQPRRMVGINFDITDRKQAEAQIQSINERLILTNAELDRATRLKDEFLANMSHELRTPLNAILGMSEGLQEGVFSPLTGGQRRAVETIERSGRHLLELINDILDLSKIEAGKLELQTAPVPVRYLCESSLSFVKQQALKKNVQLISDVPSQLPNVVADERRIRQILINLLSNAIKFTPDEGTVQLIARVEHQGSNHFLNLSVVDSGIGIAEENIAKLFQPFVQIDSSLNRQYTGTGLGLALVQRLTELHQGTVTVTSEVNRGSCFTVRLPYLVATLSAAAPVVPVTLNPLPVENAQVFVIEDSLVASEQISRYLEELDMHAVLYDRGEGAINEVIQTQPGLIILDIQLPNLSGWEVLKQLKANPQTQTIPVLMISVVDERSRGLSLGATEYLVKPITREHFRATLTRLRHPNTAPSRAFIITPTNDAVHESTEAPLLLLAEDNEMNIATISSYLTGIGYRLIYAKNGQEAVEMTRTYHPDLVLMDIQMPGMDGLEAMRQIRACPEFVDLPMVALTALAMSGDREKCLQAGATSYLSKPVKLKQLKTLIQQLLEKKSVSW